MAKGPISFSQRVIIRVPTAVKSTPPFPFKEIVAEGRVGGGGGGGEFKSSSRAFNPYMSAYHGIPCSPDKCPGFSSFRGC